MKRMLENPATLITPLIIASLVCLFSHWCSRSRMNNGDETQIFYDLLSLRREDPIKVIFHRTLGGVGVYM